VTDPGLRLRLRLRLQRRPRGEGGTILLLTLGYVVIALGLVAVVVDASAVFLARRALASACDGASLAGAQSVDVPGVYHGAASTTLPLAQVQGAVARYQAEAAPDSALTASVSGSVSGNVSGNVSGADRIVVTGSRTVTLPVSRLLGIAPVTVRARAEASSDRLTGLTSP